MRRRALIWSAVLFVALRGLIPAGFMLSFGSAGAAVTLCPEYDAPAPAGAPPHAHHPGLHHHHHAADSAGMAAAGHSAAAHGHHAGHDGARAPSDAPAPTAAASSADDRSQSAELSVEDGHGICPFAAAAHVMWHAPQSTCTFAPSEEPVARQTVAGDMPRSGVPFCPSRSPRGPPALNPA